MEDFQQAAVGRGGQNIRQFRGSGEPQSDHRGGPALWEPMCGAVHGCETGLCPGKWEVFTHGGEKSRGWTLWNGP